MKPTRPTLGMHVPDDWTFHDELAERLKDYRGKPGPYLRELVERDLSSPLSPSQLTAQQIRQWLADERTLIAAGEIATVVLSAQDAGERDSAALTLARLIVDATRRKPTVDYVQPEKQDLFVAEAKAAVKPKPHAEIHLRTQRHGQRRGNERRA